MKGNRLDDLFRDKLESHKTAAPQNAWAKIEAGLPNKRNKGAYFWLSIAASIMLFATIGWLAFSNRDVSESVNQEVLSEVTPKATNETTAKNGDSPLMSEPVEDEIIPQNIIEPLEVPVNKIPELVASNATENTEELQEAIVSESQSLLDEAFELKIETIQPKSISKPTFLVKNYTTFKVNVNSDILMQSIVLSPEEFESLDNENQRKFGFLNSIVSVAKGVNNGGKALSEIRKSKNEFITNDLKYGAKTDSPDEETNEPPTKQ